MTGDITFDEWWSELQKHEAPKKKDGMFTVTEIMEKLNIGRGNVMRHLKKAKDNGVLEVGRRLEKDLADRDISVPVYRILKKSTKK